MIALALEALAASTALMLLVLALRGPVRRGFGAQLAYLLWLLPVLRLVLPPLPSDWSPFVAAPIAGVGERAMVLIAPVAPLDLTAAAPVGGPGGGLIALMLLWSAGTLAFLGFQLVSYLRFRSRVLRGAQWVTCIGSVEVVESAAATGPLAFGLTRRVVAFPPDFAERYDAQERELALAHEIGHHRRGDLWANWVALVLLALHWFNPVAWMAFRAFRADQEMANDAGVLARAGAGLRHAYGRAIVKAAHGRALTPACHLNTVHDLKGRLRMLARGRVSGVRAAAGGAAVALLAGAGLVLSASGMPAAARVRAGVERATGMRLDTLDHDVAAALTPVVRKRTISKLTIIEQGRTIVLHDTAAADYIAAHPVQAPTIPPTPAMPSIPSGAQQPSVPPRPPMPPMPPTYAAHPVGVAQECDHGAVIVSRPREGRPIAVCAAANDRGARDAMRIASEASRHAMRDTREAHRAAMRAGRDAMRSALATLATTRAGLAGEAHLTGEARAEALGEIDQAMAEVRAEMAGDD